jgi:N-acetylglucosaminyldiphosphoundecaprenol N-acetyl-beta-D-mannosaminyltransferase
MQLNHIPKSGETASEIVLFRKPSAGRRVSAQEEATMSIEHSRGQDSVCREYPVFDVMGVPIAATSIHNAIETLLSWLQTGDTTRLVTFTNVHMLTEARRKPHFLTLLREMDMNCPDGMPLVWIGRHKRMLVSRVSGPDFMPAFCSLIADNGYRNFFYGGNEGIAERAVNALKRDFPNLQIAGWFTPPFTAMTREEDETIIRMINDSCADVVWVCLGCPKQELWMAEHRTRLNARLVLSVGMAFDVLAGRKSRAPKLLRDSGLEWLFRLISEPRRLIWRYFYSNCTFIHWFISEGIFEPRTIRDIRSAQI